MKILYSILAFLLLAGAPLPLYCMEEQRQLGFTSNDADAFSLLGDPTPLVDDFTQKTQSGKNAKKRAKRKSTLLITNPMNNAYEESTEPITEGFFSLSTKTAGSDEYAQGDVDDDSTEKEPPTSVTKIFEEHIVQQHKSEDNDNQEPQMTPLIPQSDKGYEQKSNFSWTKILEIFKADDELQKELLGDHTLSDIISPEQKGNLKTYYRFQANLDQLTELFLHLKSKLSKMPLEQKKESVEFTHSEYIYAAVVKKCDGNKKEAKEILLGIADYESDEEKIMSEDFKEDGSDVYPFSKKILTYVLPKIKQKLSERQAIIDSSVAAKDDLVQQMELLQKKHDATLQKLTEDIALKHDLENAQRIIEQERIAHQKHLLEQKNQLKQNIQEQQETINQLESAIESAIIYNNNAKKNQLTKQKKETEEQLKKTKLALTNLEKNLTNFDSPTKTLGFW